MVKIDQQRELTPIEREAHAWIRRLTSGEARAADAAALRHWCGQSPAHATAFSEASQFWQAFGLADAGLRDDSKTIGRRSVVSGRITTRRAFVGGALAASAAGAMVVHPPLDLWPSLAEFRADYRTATGEQREIAMAEGMSVQLDSQTSLNVAGGGSDGIELVSGQASFKIPDVAARSVTVMARGGKTSAVSAQFDIRVSGPAVCVSCLANHVEVEYRGRRAMLAERQQVSYNKDGLAAILTIDPATVSAWQRGLLIFNMSPLADVIDELNRYRSGRIVLVNSDLSRLPVNGRFRIDRPDEALAQLRVAFGVRTRSLPGGIVLLS